MAAWLKMAPSAFDRKATPVADALFGRDEAAGLVDAPLFDVTGEPVAEAVAPLTTAERDQLEAERAALLARLAEINAKLDA